MKELEKENARLKRMLADKMLGIEILQETLEKNCKPWAQAASGREARGQCSMRAGWRYFQLHRSTYAYRAKHPDAWLTKLKAAVRRLSRQYARWGYPKITKLLKDEGWKVGKRLVQRLRRELGLADPTTQAKTPAQGCLHRAADQGRTTRPCLDLGFYPR